MANGPEPIQDPAAAIISALGDVGLQDRISEVVDAGLDQLLDPGFARDIPGVGILVAVARTAAGIREALFLRKILRFVREAGAPDARKYALQVSVDPVERRRIGESLLLYLERQEDLDKATLLGRVFVALGRGDINETRFRELATAIDRCFVPDIELLRSPADEITCPSEVGSRLTAAGLVGIETTARWDAASRAQFTKNELSRDLVRILYTRSASA